MGEMANHSGYFRHENRLKVHMHVCYGPYQNTTITGYCIDISTGGAYIKTELLLAVNEHLSLMLHMPNRLDPVTCNARVAWINPAIGCQKPELPPGVGVEFIDFTSEELDSISSFIGLTN